MLFYILLSVWQYKLSEARAAKAEAIQNIEKTRRGPMSGVISFSGDYK